MYEITRKQLTSLLDVSSCKEWLNSITQLLGSTSEDIISIPEDLITKLQTEGTWMQLNAILDLNIFKVQYPPNKN